MHELHWNKIGTGKIHLVLIHGWGFNSKIWNMLFSELHKNFKIHLVDLPGFGKNHKLKFKNLKDTAKLLEKHIPNNSILLGWSMGGLITSKIALYYPKKIIGLIHVTSSPCFIKRPNWPGISKCQLLKFYYQLTENYKETISNFIKMQNINSKCLNQEINILKNLVLSQPQPTMSTLKKGLELLYSSDLRKEITKLNIPILKIYGSLDTLVPKETAAILDQKLPNSQYKIMNQCAHAPFISNKYKFCSIILKFSQNLHILK